MFQVPANRRNFLKTTAGGFGYLALANLLQQERKAYAIPETEPKKPHHEPKAKRVIFIYMQGSPSQLDTFDYKPRLQADDGKPESTADSGNPRKWLGSPWKFAQHGQCGHWISELHSHVAKHADKLCMIKSLTTDIPNHPQAVLQLHTGSFRFTRPSMGAWVLYGLGTENQDLPGFIAINPLTRVGGSTNYGNAFLPAAYQATKIGSEASDVAQARINHIANPLLSNRLQRKQLDLLHGLQADRAKADGGPSDPELESIIGSYELAFRMQGSIPGVMDLSSETKETLKAYGVDNPVTDNFARQCLMARRFSEAGVRFVEICMPGWDHHTNLRRDMVACTSAVDQPTGALLADLEQRGLLKDTLVLFGGEFGRTPTGQGPDGRDHNVHGFTMWFAGAGVKPGFTYGETDEYGAKAIKDKCHIYDLQATILHLLGLDHEKLTFNFGGRPFRLTDVHGELLNGILA